MLGRALGTSPQNWPHGQPGHVGQMRLSDWSKFEMLRSDWSVLKPRTFTTRLAAKIAIFELSSISKKLKRFRTFEWYFRNQLTIEVIWAKYKEIQNFTTVISFSVSTGIGS